MKKLSEFVSLLSQCETFHFEDVPIRGVACRGEELKAESLYCVMDEYLEYGRWTEGVKLLESVRTGHISALLTEQALPDIPIPQLIVPEARQATARAAKFFYDAPDEQMKIIGVTGTNGKTTTTHLINRLLTACGGQAAAMGTIGIYTGYEKYAEAIYTTPLSPILFETLSELKDNGINAAAAEISSHSLKLDRVFGLDTDVAVFTNLTRDHLDFHGTMADYRASKMKLFTELKPEAVAVVNLDDPLGKEIVSVSPCPVITYGRSPDSDLRADKIVCSPRETAFRVYYKDVTLNISTPLIGDFNVSNLLAALGVCLALGKEPEALQDACSGLRGVAGRIEPVPLPGARVGIVDYAHTPDSLKKILHALRAVTTGRIITVFGCGGDRDKGKRPLMGQAAERLSDLCVVTSDNPRREDPDAIISDILTGMSDKRIVVEPDRRKAIRKAYEISQPGDLILVAGKGHERYQIIGDEKFPFDDLEELKGLNI